MPLRFRPAALAALGAVPLLAFAAAAPPPPPAANPAANLVCTAASVATTPAPASDGKTRQAAQRGLVFLARSTADWQKGNNCFGCHVQAVTLEALSVGKQNQYEIPGKELNEIVNGILRLPGGARGPGGLSHPSFPKTARMFGGLAFARYDQYVDSRLRDDLLKVAKQLLEYQQADGSVRGDYENRPVAEGAMQSTYQAMQTWRQAYARTANQTWLAPVQKAERYIHTTAERWENPKAVYLQEINYALLGLKAAGVARSEKIVTRLTEHVVSLQREDGGWGFGGASEAFATGQTLYALRMTGMTERDTAVARGGDWLVKHQKQDGGWGAGGSGKAEAMWAVLGMVSVDVITVALNGITDGDHVSAEHALSIDAKENQSGKLSKVELRIDDVPVHAACGSTLTYAWKTAGLTAGKHIVDAIATNEKGQSTRRRVEVYAGDVFLTQVGSRYERGVTTFSLRNIAPTDTRGTVQLRVMELDDKGQPKPDKVIFTAEQPSGSGAMGFTWDGKDKEGKAKPKGRYVAELQFRDASGKARQQENELFFQDTEEAQREKYGEVQGQLTIGGGAAAANTKVDLVDARGNVAQSVTTTESGQYRFKNVDMGKYKVRVRKDGFAPQEAEVQAAPKSEAAVRALSL